MWSCAASRPDTSPCAGVGRPVSCLLGPGAVLLVEHAEMHPRTHFSHFRLIDSGVVRNLVVLMLLLARGRTAERRACFVQRHTYSTQTEAYKGLHKAWLTARMTLAWLCFMGLCMEAIVTAVHRTLRYRARGCALALPAARLPSVRVPCGSGPAAQGLRHEMLHPPKCARVRSDRHGRAPHSKLECAGGAASIRHPGLAAPLRLWRIPEAESPQARARAR